MVRFLQFSSRVEQDHRRRFRWAWWAAVLALGVLALAAAPDPSAGQAASLESLEGRWTYAEGRRHLDAAIDRVADRFDIFAREIARGEIRRNVRPERRLAIGVPAPDLVEISMDDWGPVPLPLGESARVRGPDGRPNRVHARFTGGVLLMRQSSTQGTRINRLRASSDRRHLLLQVRIQSDRLPADIAYTLTYRRRR